MASLVQKDVTWATIVRKFSSYARQNQTKKALWELDNIRRSIYILDFIDDPTLEAERPESAQPRRVLPPNAQRDLLRQLRQVPRQN
jgi:hypothetical protein